MDRFINHQMDPYLMKQVAVEFMNRFAAALLVFILGIMISSFCLVWQSAPRGAMDRRLYHTAVKAGYFFGREKSSGFSLPA